MRRCTVYRCSVELFTDLSIFFFLIILIVSLTFFLFSVTCFRLPTVSPGSTGELVVTCSRVGDLDSDDYRIVGLVHVLVRLELQSRPELERSGELVVVGSGVGDLDGDDYRIAGLVFKVGRSWSNLALVRSGELIIAGSGVGDLDGDDYQIAGLVFKVGQSWSDLVSSSLLAWRSRR
jgi:hypothetical protein